MTIDRSCGPEGCQLDWLVSQRLEVDADPVAFAKFATDSGWGDGLPLVPPTEARVREHVAASGRFPDDVLGDLPPRNGRCTVEKVAINAVMAGAPPESMPLLCAAIEAMTDKEVNLFALNTTTCCVIPGVFVNGPARHTLGIPYGAGCFGGQAGPAPAIGRALRLVMRNVGGQVVGLTSKSVFGQPARVTGIVVAEWEERSPWAPLGERRGVPGNALTIKDVTGTIDVADITAQNGVDLLEIIGKSLAFPGTNTFIGRRRGRRRDHGVHRAALGGPDCGRLPRHRRGAAQAGPTRGAADLVVARAAPQAAGGGGRVDARGMVPLVARPDQMIVMVCGGLGNLHALALHSFGPTQAVTRPF